MNTTPSPTSQMRFAFSWRPYQQRVLDALDSHLADRRLHVVAAPGSGKTILGLEAFRRLGRPAVVLSPTRIIRDQWVMRLQHFLPTGTPNPPAWASRDLSAPGFLTSITYQALHTKYRAADTSEDEEESSGEQAPDAGELKRIIERFREIGVGTLILDEAHHLRQEWWKALSRLAAALDDVALVSLTATPPYDVVGREWRRYEELCGPIDEEISVPELVKSGTLCPHQDYVRAVRLSPAAARCVREHDAQVERLAKKLLSDDDLLAAIEQHPWLTDPHTSAEAVLGAPEFTFAMLIYLRARERLLPKALLRLLGTRADDLPEIGKRWWQVLVEHYLYGDTWTPDPQREQHRDNLMTHLRAEGLLYRRELRLLRSRSIEAVLTQTPDKIDACVEIHKLERAQRGAALKEVILTDFIRDDELAAADTPTLGAWPIFRALAEHAEADEREALALLTGRLVVVHQTRLPAIRAALGGDDAALSTQPLSAPCDDHVRITSPAGNQLVGVLTQLLSQGQVEVLVGTRALLGEGWDAPPVNSLVLASYVGSFVLTNQMRGRALRRDPQQPDKAASVWHIVAVDPETPSGWADVAGLQRRFDTFVGIGARRPVLESGLERMELPADWAGDWVAETNTEMQQRFAQHTQVAQQWQQAIASEEIGRVLPSVRVANPPRVRSFVFRNTLVYLLTTASSICSACYGLAGQSARSGSTRIFFWTLAAAGVLATALSLPYLVRAAWLALRHLPVDGSLRSIALTLHKALCETGHIQAGGSNPTTVRVKEAEDGTFTASLAGESFRESALYADCLAELLGPIENPRYLITRPGSGWFSRRADYHAVPHILGVRKESAEVLHKIWRRYMGGGKLFYTRNARGRRKLLRARIRALSSMFANRTERLDQWQ